MFLIIDFGSQTTHLISRRLRELGAEVEIILPENSQKKIKELKPKGIIFSGGPASVYEKNAPTVDSSVFEMNIPILGICYGEQLIAYLLNGKVIPGTKKEFGPAKLEIKYVSPLLKGVSPASQVWMSHGDQVVAIPKGFQTDAVTETIPHAAISHTKRNIFGIQFHPEVIHTQFGEQILKNFLSLCKIPVKKQSITKKFTEHMIEDIKESVGNGKAICALSGGVDSSVAALLVHKAIGTRLTALYIDSGLMRHEETETLEKVFEKHYHMKVRIIHAQEIFLRNLKGIVDPEEKRKIIGKTFIDVFEREAAKEHAVFLVQGTIYPDVIESSGTKHSDKIKSHHNVGGLPDRMNLSLLEPLRTFYKDEVRAIGKILGIPEEIVARQPFPGPGLAIRIIGEVTKEKLAILRKADAIVQEEITKQTSHTLWQTFAVLTGIKTTGVRGDQRAYGETIAIRAIEAKDAMSARWARLPYDILDAISVRIVNEIPQVNRVVYDITNKPPATMEWE